jgi:hypothetical protein
VVARIGILIVKMGQPLAEVPKRCSAGASLRFC